MTRQATVRTTPSGYGEATYIADGARQRTREGTGTACTRGERRRVRARAAIEKNCSSSSGKRRRRRPTSGRGHDATGYGTFDAE